MGEPDRTGPVTAAQLGMLLQRQLHPQYHDRLNLAMAWHFSQREAVDPVALGEAFSLVAKRHEALRTGFRLTPQPLAEVHALPHVPFQVIALASADGADSQILASELAAVISRPFDISAGPLFRGALFDLGSGGCVVLLVVHHLVGDGWSAGVLTQDLADLYHMAISPADAKVAEANSGTRQVTDVAAEQRDQAAAGQDAQALRYWVERLTGVQVVELPSDRPRPSRPSGDGATVRTPVPAGVIDGLRGLVADTRSSLFTVGLAAFQTLAGRYAGVGDVAIGTPVAGRDDPSSWQTVGLLANTLVVRADLSGDPPFRELVGTVRDTVLEAMEHQQAPFERVVAALNPPRLAGRNPLFQLMFALDRTIPLALGAHTGTPLLLDRDISMFDLAVTLLQHQDGWYVQAQYDSDLFDRATVSRLVDNYLSLLAGAAREPELAISRLPMVSPAERELLVAWGGRPSGPDPGDTLHGLIEGTADRLPGSIATVVGTAEMSYAQLDAQANALAHRLRELGVGRSDVVGVCAGRSLRLVVALLGVWKAGAGYLPLDPTYPAERLAFMATDAGARVVVADAAPAFGLGPEVAVVRLDKLAPRSRPDRPVSGAAGADLAYLIYTSGSTGVPKAVAVPHSAVVSAFHAWDALYALPREGARYPQVASFSFDNSVGEFVRPLCSGGTLYMCEQSELRDPDAFVAYLARVRPYFMDVVPAFIRLMQRGARYDTVLPQLGLRHLAIGGEQWTPAEAESLRERLPGARLLNVYGLTEATVDSTYHVVEAPYTGTVLPIGRPFANTSVYVVDAHDECLPAGVTGELCIAGHALAWGYLNRPALTAERFVPDPDGEPGARKYRTGDRCRFRGDGTLEFLGRDDAQVKVRGFRVELGEVEAALVRCEGVKHAAVELRQGQRDNIIVAYLVAAGHIDLATVRGELSQTLPGYMLPSALVQLPELPLLPNGKVDRAALPDPPEAPAAEAATQAMDPLTREVAEIWAKVLGRPAAGPQESFFGLGGTSLLAIQVVAEVRQRLGRLVPFTALFDHQALATFTEACRSAPEVTHGQSVTDDGFLAPVRADEESAP